MLCRLRRTLVRALGWTRCGDPTTPPEINHFYSYLSSDRTCRPPFRHRIQPFLRSSDHLHPTVTVFAYSPAPTRTGAYDRLVSCRKEPSHWLSKENRMLRYFSLRYLIVHPSPTCAALTLPWSRTPRDGRGSDVAFLIRKGATADLSVCASF